MFSFLQSGTVGYLELFAIIWNYTPVPLRVRDARCEIFCSLKVIEQNLSSQQPQLHRTHSSAVNL